MGYSSCPRYIHRLHVTSFPPCWRTTTKYSSLASIISSSNMAATSFSFQFLGNDWQAIYTGFTFTFLFGVFSVSCSAFLFPYNCPQLVGKVWANSRSGCLFNLWSNRFFFELLGKIGRYERPAGVMLPTTCSRGVLNSSICLVQIDFLFFLRGYLCLYYIQI